MKGRLLKMLVPLSLLIGVMSFQSASDPYHSFNPSKDTTLSPAFEELRKKTEDLFEAKKDSFRYESTLITGGPNFIYSIVRIGNLFNRYDRHALIAYSLNPTTLYVEVRQLIGKVWVRRFRNSSDTRNLEAHEDPVSLTDLNGDQIPELFIAKELAMPAQLIRGDAWTLTRDGFQKWKGFDQIENPEYDPKEKQWVGHFISQNGLSMSFGVYSLKKNTEVVRIKYVFCDCTSGSGDTCLVATDSTKPHKVLHDRMPGFVPAYFSKMVRDQNSRSK